MFPQGGLCELILLCLPALQHVSLSAPVTENSNIYTTQGDKVTLPCLMDCPPGTPVTKVTGKWEWQDREHDSRVQTIVQYLGSVPQRGAISLATRSNVHSSYSSGNFGLNIASVQAEDGGIFKCDFRFKTYTAQATVQLYVVQVTSNSSNPLLQGEGVSLRCHTPAGQVSWTGPHGVRRTENPLLLERVSLQEGGKWTCSVEFTSGESLLVSYQLVVIGFTESPDETIYLPAGSSALLPCSLNLLPSWDSVGGGWFRAGAELLVLKASASGWEWRPVQESHLQAGSGRSNRRDLSVSLRSATMSAGDEYQCQLRLHHRSMSRRVRVTVIQVNASEPGSVKVGANVSLECRLTHSSQLTHLRWRQNRSSSSGTVSRRGRTSHTIHLVGVSRREAGEWICEILENDRAVGKATYTLNVT
ncbi:CD4-2 molecule, tandem duplicate 2, partial [Carcharodon carcharias]|uniref:CD4-2 molecule, tandem duplicate 2 n=1 Tax=Carcharodon carcharias TaxID=13397 RepID=UPI001B7DC61C